MSDRGQTGNVFTLAKAAGNTLLVVILIQIITGIIQPRANNPTLTALHYWSGNLIVLVAIYHLGSMAFS